MKNPFLTLSLALFFYTSFAQPTATIHTSGRYILGNCNDTLILRGMNYAPYNWGYSSNQLRIDQIALTGANAVRIPWYASGNPVLYSDYVYLDSAISKCIQYDMIPIIELHDQTCQNTAGALIELANFYTQPSILAIIQKYKHSLIVNIANEALFVNWTANIPQSTQIYENTYATIITNLRNEGITVPLMIDAPDCGTNLDVLSSVGASLIAHDPLQNIIFSAHTYWYAFANNDSLTYLNKINNALSSNIPFIFGEVANLQDDQVLCQYVLNYKPILSICQAKKIGWLAWSWDNDGCPNRQVSSTGNYANLTTYGNVIVHNPTYGIKHTSVRSKFLVYNSCMGVAIHPPIPSLEGIMEWKESSDAYTCESLVDSDMEIICHSIMGQLSFHKKISPYEHLTIAKSELPAGVFILQAKVGNEVFYEKHYK